MDIPSLPVGMASILSIANSETATADDVARAIMLDPALSTKVLRMANSAFYGRLTAAETVTQAVVTLGFGAVKTIALAASVVDHILPEASAPGLSWRAFWRHCVTTGAAAELILKEITGQRRTSESAFVAGLLHDVGKLIIARNVPDEFSRVVETATENGGDFAAAEKRVLATDHTVVGSLLSQEWRIPDVIADPIVQHHKPASGPDVSSAVAAVRGANLLSKMVFGGYLKNVETVVTPEQVEEACGLDSLALEQVMQDLPDRVAECEEVLQWGSDLPESEEEKAAA